MGAIVLVFVAFFLPLVAVGGAVVTRSAWPGTVTNILLGVVLLLGVLDLLAWGAIATDFRDAAGFIDCWPACTPLQQAVGAAIFWGPVLMAAAVVITAAYLRTMSGRGKRRPSE